MRGRTVSGDAGHFAVRRAAPPMAAWVGVGLAMAAIGGCSIVPDWLRPGSATGREVKSVPGAGENYPTLGGVPERPVRSESADTRREIARGLVADREQAHYSDQALRGGTEASAAPPPPPMPGALQALPDEGETATGASMTLAENTDKADKPGFFARLFGKKEKEKTPDPDKPEPLPAQPTGKVDVQPAPATTN